MTDNFPRVGQVFEYYYLWKWQDERGETEGRKKRPSCVILIMINNKDQHVLFIAPITSKEPAKGRIALAIPETEARRANLDVTMRLWVMVDELNADILETSYTLEDRSARGQFSTVFMDKILQAVQNIRASNALRLTSRT